MAVDTVAVHWEVDRSKVDWDIAYVVDKDAVVHRTVEASQDAAGGMVSNFGRLVDVEEQGILEQDLSLRTSWSASRSPYAATCEVEHHVLGEGLAWEALAVLTDNHDEELIRNSTAEERAEGGSD